MITRRQFLRVFAGTFASAAGLGGYAFGVEPGLRLREQRWRIAPAAWPRGFGLRIAAIADLHAGAPYMSESRIAAIVERTNALEADLIVLLGDYAAGHKFVSKPVKVADTARILSGLRAPFGVYGVLGNHDWWDDFGAQKRGAGPTIAHQAFTDAGLPILENDAVRIEAPRGAFWIVGLGDQLAFPTSLRRQLGGPSRNFEPSILPSWGTDDLDGALAKLTDDAPAILLAHEPDIFPRVPSRVALTLSGHTHGGQIRAFGFSPVVPSRYGNRYAYGVIEENDRALVVSGGLGCSILPVRFGVPPEITVIELS